MPYNLQYILLQPKTNMIIIYMLARFLLISISIFHSTLAIDCNSTHFEFYSNYSLGKQEQLNGTFTQIEPLITIQNITHKQSEMATYVIHNASIKFRYIDSRQKAVIIGKDTIGVYGGRLETTVTFNWTKQTLIVPLSGWGIARIASDEIMFQKVLEIDKGYLDYQLGFAYNVTLQSTNFTMTRIQPPNTSENDTACIMKTLNGPINGPIQNISFKQSLQTTINSYFVTYLRRNLKNQHYPLDDHFDYTYNNRWSGKNITLNFMLIPTGVDLEQSGLSLTFVSYLKDDSNWKCGKSIPTKQFDPKVYGGLQQFISFSIFQNSIRYAFEQGFLNTILNKNNWQSRFFQFFAGDLYDVIPEVANNFIAMEKVQGNCTYNTQQQIKIKKRSNSTISTQTYHNCALYITTTKIADFEVKLNLVIQSQSNETHLNFRITETAGESTFRNITGFTIKNQDLASHMVSHCITRLKQGHTFGSGWKIYPRDYSHMLIQDDYFVIYDSTHIELSEQLI